MSELITQEKFDAQVKATLCGSKGMRDRLLGEMILARGTKSKQEICRAANVPEESKQNLDNLLSSIWSVSRQDGRKRYVETHQNETVEGIRAELASMKEDGLLALDVAMTLVRPDSDAKPGKSGFRGLFR